jgi:hypothetical protein
MPSGPAFGSAMVVLFFDADVLMSSFYYLQADRACGSSSQGQTDSAF